MSPIPTNNHFTWRGKPADKLSDKELGDAKSHVRRTLATLQAGVDHVQELLPRYRANPSIFRIFESYLVAIEAEATKRGVAL